MNRVLFIDFTGPFPIAAVFNGKRAFLIKGTDIDGIKLIPAILKKILLKPERIVVARGPGSFSSVRASVLAGNMLAELLRVPAVGVIKKEGVSAEELVRAGLAFRRTRGQIRPYYNLPPNITIPKTI